MVFLDEDVVVVGTEPVTVRGSFTDSKTGTWYRVEDFNGKLRVVHEKDVRPETSGVWSSLPDADKEELAREEDYGDARFQLDFAKGWE